LGFQFTNAHDKNQELKFNQPQAPVQTKSIEFKSDHVLNFIKADERIKWMRFGPKTSQLKWRAHRKYITRFNLSVNGLFGLRLNSEESPIIVDEF